jgi:predicted O-methyltransferase YrrM
MDLLEKTDDRYQCAPGAAELLSATHPEAVLPMVLHAAQLWHGWGRLTAVVCGPEGAPTPYLDPARAFIGAMHVAGRGQAAQLAQVIQPAGARRLLDVGGASGTYTMALLDAAPDLRATIFDLPPVIPLARKRLEEAGYLDRVDLVAGDLETDVLPGGHDLVLLSAIIHSYSLEQNLALYRNCRQALVPGGRLVIRDHVMSGDRTRPKAGALFAINMLVNTEGGGTYTLQEILDGLGEAGFERVRLLQPGEMMNGIVEAT